MWLDFGKLNKMSHYVGLFYFIAPTNSYTLALPNYLGTFTLSATVYWSAYLE